MKQSHKENGLSGENSCDFAAKGNASIKMFTNKLITTKTTKNYKNKLTGNDISDRIQLNKQKTTKNHNHKGDTV